MNKHTGTGIMLSMILLSAYADTWIVSDEQRNHHEMETAKRIVDAVQRKAIAL